MCAMIPIFLTAKLAVSPVDCARPGLAVFGKIILAALRYFPKKPCTIRSTAVMAVRKPEHWLREPVYV